MIGPELAYAFAKPQDTVGGTLAIVAREVNAGASAAQIDSTLYTVPQDKVLVISSLNATLTPGAAQIARFGAFRINVGTIIELFTGPEIENATANRVVNLWWTGEVWMPPGSALEFRGTFDAGAALNNSFSRVTGNLIPRGNVQLA